MNVILISGLVARILWHDEHQRFLFRELEHRSRNLFAVVQEIASRTLVDSPSLVEAKSALGNRLASLARTHAMLGDSQWTGAPLDQILSEELFSFANQVSNAGCNVLLSTPAAQNFALIIHELATNAAKHGALSCAQGKVTIHGKIVSHNGNKLFRFGWTEFGGPTVGPPQRTGFGSSILKRLAKRFAQTVEIIYCPEGLKYELQIPLSSIQALSSSPIDTVVAAPSREGPEPIVSIYKQD